jgi:hypothetical protein
MWDVTLCSLRGLNILKENVTILMIKEQAKLSFLPVPAPYASGFVFVL